MSVDDLLYVEIKNITDNSYWYDQRTETSWITSNNPMLYYDNY